MRWFSGDIKNEKSERSKEIYHDFLFEPYKYSVDMSACDFEAKTNKKCATYTFKKLQFNNFVETLA